MPKTGKISFPNPTPFSKTQSAISQECSRIFAAYTVASP